MVDRSTDVWLYLFSFLDMESLFQAAKVSKRFHTFAWRTRKGFPVRDLVTEFKVMERFGLLSEIQWLHFVERAGPNLSSDPAAEVLCQFPALRSLGVHGCYTTPNMTEVRSTIFFSLELFSVNLPARPSSG